MLAFAIDHPAPATVILITNDRDFVYAVSVLRLRRYRVILIARPLASISLRSQASVWLDWNVEILENCERKMESSKGGPATHNAIAEAVSLPTPPPSPPAHPQGITSPCIISGVINHTTGVTIGSGSLVERPLLSFGLPIVNTSLRDVKTIPRADLSPQVSGLESRNTVSISTEAHTNDPTTTVLSAEAAVSVPSMGSPQQGDFPDAIRNSSGKSNRAASSDERRAGRKFWAACRRTLTSFKLPFRNNHTKSAQHRVSIILPSDHVADQPFLLPSTSPEIVSLPVAEPAATTTATSSILVVSSSPVAEIETTTLINVEAEPEIPENIESLPTVPLSNKLTVTDINAGVRSSTVTAQTPLPTATNVLVPLVRPRNVPVASMAKAPAVRQSVSPVPAGVRRPPQVPAEFAVLVEELRSYRRKGLLRVSFAKASKALIKRDQLAYQRAGIKGKKNKFQKLATLAVKAGVATTGVAEGISWISVADPYINV